MNIDKPRGDVFGEFLLKTEFWIVGVVGGGGRGGTQYHMQKISSQESSHM
jgi:hypothetical protein